MPNALEKARLAREAKEKAEKEEAAKKEAIASKRNAALKSINSSYKKGAYDAKEDREVRGILSYYKEAVESMEDADVEAGNLDTVLKDFHKEFAEIPTIADKNNAAAAEYRKALKKAKDAIEELANPRIYVDYYKAEELRDEVIEKIDECKTAEEVNATFDEIFPVLKKKCSRLKTKKERNKRVNKLSNQGSQIAFTVDLAILIASLIVGILLFVFINNEGGAVLVLGTIFFILDIVLLIGSVATLIIFFVQSGFFEPDNGLQWAGRWGRAGVSFFALIALFSYLGSGRLEVQGFVYEEESGLTYVLRKNFVSIRHGNGKTASINIPERYDGKPVTWIEGEAFKGDQSLQEVTFNGHVLIEDRAFAETLNLKKVTFNNGSYSLDADCFANNPTLKDIYMNNSDIERWDVIRVPFENNSNDLTLHVNGGSITYALEGIGNVIYTKGSIRYLKSQDCLKTLVLTEDCKLDAPNEIVKTGMGFNDYYHPLAYNIYIPTSVTNIPSCFFGDSLPDGNKPLIIHYAGSQAEWGNVSINSSHNDMVTKIHEHPNVTIRYNDPYQGA